MSSSRSVLLHDTALHARPTALARHDAVERADVKVVLDVDGHRVDDRPDAGHRASSRALLQHDGLDRVRR